jgi:glycosyltransferase involved in cell wall biosynthesis
VFHSLKEATLQHQADVIHFIDNVGPILPLIRYMLPTVHISSGKPSARIAFSKGWWFYKQLLNFSYKTSDCVVTYSETCKNSLVSSGIGSGQIRVVPWGIKIPPSLSPARIHEIRTKYGCSATRNLLVVGLPRGDLHEVVAISREISRILPTVFVFAIRPTLYKDSYATLSDEYVKIIKGPEDFHDLLAAADIAFADQPSSPSTSLPPLAWLEAMVRSTPVITRNVPGMEETVKNNVTGFIYEEVTELKEILAKVAGDRIFLEQLQKQSCSYVTQKHNIESIAIQYADIWHRLCPSELETNSNQ